MFGVAAEEEERVVVVEEQLEQALAALAADDWDGLALVLSNDFFGYTPRLDEPTAGERLVPLLSEIKAAMPDLHISVDGLRAEGVEVSGILTLTGTHTDPLWGSPGSGNEVRWVTPVTFKEIDGRLAFRIDDLAFPELVDVLRQLGLVNEPDEMDKPLAHPVVFPEFLLKVAMTGQAGDKGCDHVGQIQVTEPATRQCAKCVEEGVIWPALRMCLTCGHVGCCDTSQNKHARRHFEETGHPLMRSIRMDEGWVWCYADDAFFEKAILSADQG